MLDFTHDGRLVLAALAVALMAGFTGLSLTRGAWALALGQSKLVVSMSAVALGAASGRCVSWRCWACNC